MLLLGCETWCGNKVLRKVFGPKKYFVTYRWRKYRVSIS
jgi:hypothetical protein